MNLLITKIYFILLLLFFLVNLDVLDLKLKGIVTDDFYHFMSPFFNTLMIIWEVFKRFVLEQHAFIQRSNVSFSLIHNFGMFR